MGYFYEHGIAVTQDKTQALRWYQVAANDQNTEAMAAVTRLSH
ncbi:SEL1-like repeat protein [Vibrio fluvialis]|nr:SEL1-like repeat protein [Vibrio fluvialis]